MPKAVPDASHLLSAAVTALEAELARLPDAQQRAVRVTSFLAEIAQHSREVARMRLDPVGELRASGLSYRKIASLLGLSENAVIQIDRERTDRPRWRRRGRTS